MPKYSSGKVIGVSVKHIPDPGFEFFDCPADHFWYQTPDLAINKPPFERENQIICDFVHSLVPQSRKEAERFVQLVYIDEEASEYWWEGDWLTTFVRPADFTDADWVLFQEWRASESIGEFLDHVIQKCRAQAEARSPGGGLPAFRAGSKPQGDPVIWNEIKAVQRELLRLEAPMERAFSERDGSAAVEIFTALQELHTRAEVVSMQAGPEASAALHVQGIALRMLKEHGAAERCFRESLKLAPFALDVWLELTWCCAEQGKLADAEEAARRATAIDARSATAWGNLAMVLIQRKKRVEARQAIDRAISLDPSDEKNQYIAASFDRYAWD